MLVFLTGANGFVGRHVIEALIANGHSVLALAHHDRAAETVTKLGATVHRGSLDDIESLRAGASKADAVIHCGFNHDFTKHVEACATDLEAVRAMLEELGKDKPFVATSAPLFDTGDDDYVEDMELEGLNMYSPRGKADLVSKAKGKEGYRTAIIRLPPSVHGPQDPNFITHIISTSQKHGHVGYVGDGKHKWAAVHVKDAANLYVATLEGLANGSIPGGQTLHASEDSGHPTKVIAEIIASEIINVDIGSITVEQSMERYSPYIGSIWGGKRVMQSDITRKVTGWEPKEQNLVEDLRSGVYTKVESQ